MMDLHTHTRFSPDSQGDPEENIKVALERGIKVLAFTDHVDRFVHNNGFDYCFDLEEYFSLLRGLREKYRNQIEILIGVEIGLGLEIAQWMDQFMEEHPFDFIIGSIHSVFEEDIAWNRGKLNSDPQKWYQAYYETMLACVQKTKNFHILGHIDYIDRYMEDKSKIPPYEEFEDVIDEILKELIGSQRGIEYNLAGFKKNLPYGNPKDKILTRYLQLGGKIISLSTDSHSPLSIGEGIYKGMDHLKSLGFDHLALARKKKIQLIPIP